MAILVQCAACGQRFSAADYLAGKQALCSCKAVITVPTPGPALTLLDDSDLLAVPTSSFANSPLAVPAQHHSSVLDYWVQRGQPTLLAWGVVACTLLLAVFIPAVFYLAFRSHMAFRSPDITIATPPEPVQKVIWDGPHGRNYGPSLPLPASLFPETGEPPRTVPVNGWLELMGPTYYGDEQPEVAMRRGLARVPDVIPETLEYYCYNGRGTRNYRVGLKQYPTDERYYFMDVMKAIKGVGFINSTVGLHNDQFQITYTPTQLPAALTPAVPAALGPRTIDVKSIARIVARDYNGATNAADALRAALSRVDGLMPESIVFNPEQGDAQAYLEKQAIPPGRIEAVLGLAGFQHVRVSITTRYAHVTVNEHGEVSPPLLLPKNEPVANSPPATIPRNDTRRKDSPAAQPSAQPFTAAATWRVTAQALPVQPRNDVNTKLTNSRYGIPPTLHFSPRPAAKVLVRNGSGKNAPTTLIDLPTGQAIKWGKLDADQILAVSPSGQAVLGDTHKELRVWQWDRDQPRLVATLAQPEIALHYQHATFLDDHRVLIGQSTDNIASLWNLQTNRLEWGLQDCDPKHAVLSPDLHYLAIANGNGTQVNFYATLNMQCAGTISSGNEKRHFRNLFFSPDGKQLFAQIVDQFRQHWLVGYDLANGQPYQPIQLPSENNNSVFFACADQRFVVVRSVAWLVVVDLQYQQVVWAYDETSSVLKEFFAVRQDPAGRVWHFQSIGETRNFPAHQLLQGDYVPREREVNAIEQKLAHRAPILKTGDTVRLEIKVLGQPPEQGFEERLRQAITKQLATRNILITPQSSRAFSVTVSSREGTEDVRPTIYYISGESPDDRIMNRQQVSARELEVDVQLAIVDEQGQTPWAWQQTTGIHPAAWNLQQGPIAPEVALRYLPWRHAISAIETLPFPAEFHPRTAGPLGKTRLPLGN